MELNTEEEVLKTVGIKITMRIARFEKLGTFKKEELYEGHWKILEKEMLTAIRQGENFLDLENIWDEIKESKKIEFIDKFKAAHKQRDERNSYFLR